MEGAGVGLNSGPITPREGGLSLSGLLMELIAGDDQHPIIRPYGKLNSRRLILLFCFAGHWVYYVQTYIGNGEWGNCNATNLRFCSVCYLFC